LAARAARHAWLTAPLALALAAGACGTTPDAAHKLANYTSTARAQRNVNQALPPAATDTFVCSATKQQPMVQGDPHLRSVPSVDSVKLVPNLGGLVVKYTFRAPLVLAPAGVYISWTVYLYRQRADANHPTKTIELQIEDRGPGWEPTGWTIEASTYTDTSPVAGDVHTDKARDELTTFFPAGFANLHPPFYWFASQEELRAYLPQDNNAASPDWAINGSITKDCPAGVRPDPGSLPYPAKLLTAP
jgi:hypothetical protein